MYNQKYVRREKCGPTRPNYLGKSVQSDRNTLGRSVQAYDSHPQGNPYLWLDAHATSDGLRSILQRLYCSINLKLRIAIA